jgi:hypothetical protein
MKRALVTFMKEMDVTVYVPDDCDEAELRRVAEEVAAGGMREWDDPDWEVDMVGKLKEADTPPSSRNDHVCLSDSRDDIIAPEDASWWKAEVADAPED